MGNKISIKDKKIGLGQASMAMSDLFLKSVKELEDVLDKKKVATDMTKISATSISAFTRLHGSEVHLASLICSLIARSGGKEEDFKEALKALKA